jgi:hypothetical protein
LLRFFITDLLGALASSCRLHESLQLLCKGSELSSALSWALREFVQWAGYQPEDAATVTATARSKRCEYPEVLSTFAIETLHAQARAITSTCERELAQFPVELLGLAYGYLGIRAA